MLRFGLRDVYLPTEDPKGFDNVPSITDIIVLVSAFSFMFWYAAFENSYPYIAWSWQNIQLSNSWVVASSKIIQRQFNSMYYNHIKNCNIFFQPTTPGLVIQILPAQIFSTWVSHTCSIWDSTYVFPLLGVKTVGLLVQYRQLWKEEREGRREWERETAPKVLPCSKYGYL